MNLYKWRKLISSVETFVVWFFLEHYNQLSFAANARQILNGLDKKINRNKTSIKIESHCNLNEILA